MKYHQNLRLLSKLMGVSNLDSIPEEELGIRQLIFRNDHNEVFVVDASPTNRGGRLFLQRMAARQDTKTFAYVTWTHLLNFTTGFKQTAADFFSDIWEDFSPTKRTLLYGIANYTSVEIVWKEDFFD